MTIYRVIHYQMEEYHFTIRADTRDRAIELASLAIGGYGPANNTYWDHSNIDEEWGDGDPLAPGLDFEDEGQ